MSWMDSWSRPSKSSAIPPPLYLTVGPGETIPYCHTCGRVISSRKTHNNAQEVKYCSHRCRHSKPGALDRRIEATFVALLNGASVESLKKCAVKGEEQKERDVGVRDSKEKKRKKKGSKSTKGDPRIIVECATIEDIVFPRHQDPEKIYGRRKNRAARGIVEKPEDWRSVDMVDEPSTSMPMGTRASASTSNHPPELVSDEGSVTESEDEEEDGGGIILDGDDQEPDYGYGGGKVRPPQKMSDVNGSVGGEKGWAERTDETNEMKEKRREGQRKADEREMVRRAARRGCAFGFGLGGDEKAKCEAIMKGVVVESSFAKGEWGIRWREKY